MNKHDIHLSIFSEGETGMASIDTRKYSDVPWDIEDYDQAISALQFGLRSLYKQKYSLIKEKAKLKSEIDDLIQ